MTYAGKRGNQIGQLPTLSLGPGTPPSFEAAANDNVNFDCSTSFAFHAAARFCFLSFLSHTSLATAAVGDDGERLEACSNIASIGLGTCQTCPGRPSRTPWMLSKTSSARRRTSRSRSTLALLPGQMRIPRPGQATTTSRSPRGGRSSRSSCTSIRMASTSMDGE